MLRRPARPHHAGTFVAVLIGSSERMGSGTNAHNRLAASHHLDATWRPSDVRQRDGRGIRQGNQCKEVGINAYITEGSFDAFTWQGLERKAGFINSYMKGDLTTREVNDVGDEALNFSEVKALASGDPPIADKAAAAVIDTSSHGELTPGKPTTQISTWIARQRSRPDLLCL